MANPFMPERRVREALANAVYDKGKTFELVRNLSFLLFFLATFLLYGWFSVEGGVSGGWAEDVTLSSYATVLLNLMQALLLVCLISAQLAEVCDWLQKASENDVAGVQKMMKRAETVGVIAVIVTIAIFASALFFSNILTLSLLAFAIVALAINWVYLGRMRRFKWDLEAAMRESEDPLRTTAPTA